MNSLIFISGSKIKSCEKFNLTNKKTDNFPALRNCRIDHTTQDNSELNHLLLAWNKEISQGKVTAEKKLESDGKFYKVLLRQLPLSRSAKIHLFKIEDETSMHN